MSYAIYGLRAKRTRTIRYVGMSLNPDHRLTQHKQAARRGEYSARFADWLLANDIVVQVMAEAETSDQARVIELRMIRELDGSLFNAQGFRPTRKPSTSSVAAA